MQIVIGCVREHGMIRGGVRHPRGVAAHFVTAFSVDQLREIVAEPDLLVVIGKPLTAAEIDRIAAEREQNTPPQSNRGAAGAADQAPAAGGRRGGKG